MHELSIAESVVDIVHRYVPGEDLDKVRTVHMRIGTMSGVILDSLEFSFQAIISGTPLAAASLSVETVPFRIHCSACNETLPSESGFSTCPKCMGTETNIVSGMELQVVSINLCEPVTELS